MQILIVDDEPVELFLSKRFLGNEYQVVGFNTLPEAVQWAKNNSFDILISDYHLDKGLLAPDVLKALQDVKGKTFRSFVQTNHTDEEKTNAMKQAGFDGVIEKPVSLEKFKNMAGL